MRLKGITLLETLVSLALVVLLFALLIPLFKVSSGALEAATRASVTAGHVSFRSDVRRAVRTMIVDSNDAFSPSGNENSLTLYSFEPIMARPQAQVQMVSVSLYEHEATVTRTALAPDQTVLFEDSRTYPLDLKLTFSFLPACQEALEWQDVLESPPIAIRLTHFDGAFWPDFTARRPLVSIDGC